MKVVLFCGGLGMRIRDLAENTPKPLLEIGQRPILWHLMKYYAHYGHRHFILCLGYRGEALKRYFLNYDECVSNNFTLSEGGSKLELLNRDIQDWKITFVDTGLDSNIGQRLKAVEEHLAGESEFLANYSDGLSDLPLPQHIEHFRKHGKIASFVCVKPNLSYHFVSAQEDSLVISIRDIRQMELRINGGFFIFKSEIFKYLRDGEELVHEPFQRLIRENQLVTYPYDGFWAGMDTFKDKQWLDRLYACGQAPWQVWKPDARK
jgi:glucose-1-phosphate cytidylyltransferase